MNSKNVELNAAKERLTKLIENLHLLKLEYDEALEHAARYHGSDERIENARDERARDVYMKINEVQNEITNQTKLIEALEAAH